MNFFKFFGPRVDVGTAPARRRRRLITRRRRRRHCEPARPALTMVVSQLMAEGVESGPAIIDALSSDIQEKAP